MKHKTKGGDKLYIPMNTDKVKEEKKTMEFYNLAVELKKWFEERDIRLGLTDTYYGQLAILIQKKLEQAYQKGREDKYKELSDERLKLEARASCAIEGFKQNVKQITEG